jgi:hypothetical protein
VGRVGGSSALTSGLYAADLTEGNIDAKLQHPFKRLEDQKVTLSSNDIILRVDAGRIKPD